MNKKDDKVILNTSDEFKMQIEVLKAKALLNSLLFQDQEELRLEYGSLEGPDPDRVAVQYNPCDGN